MDKVLNTQLVKQDFSSSFSMIVNRNRSKKHVEDNSIGIHLYVTVHIRDGTEVRYQIVIAKVG